MELTSKRESNCNIMTCRSQIARNPVTPQPRLPCHHFEFFFVLLQPYYIDSILPLVRVNLTIIIPCVSTFPLDRLETRVAMMLVDQTNKTCRSNVGRDLGDVQSMSMVTTQPFADYERAVKCQLTYSVFHIANKSLSARG